MEFPHLIGLSDLNAKGGDVSDRDVTNLVKFDLNDDTSLPLLKCVCGRQFKMWEHIIGMEPKGATLCSRCGRNLYFEVVIKVYEIDESVSS